MMINKRKVILEKVLVVWCMLPKSVGSAHESQRSESSAYTVHKL